ncbi:hypothetical protein [Minwuia thermotolerans]|uniref:DUF2946 domain-containing protein n=1 Tax=Minwuia thermotolerans TaxID=2056226 RepID=A0A2M9FXG1_9PROT|nr:hypothetical protein [Minwuia thermotolerans]PJK28151.1 hypothetical protein CVT23_19165 [Minwuia thermotolerans]
MKFPAADFRRLLILAMLIGLLAPLGAFALGTGHMNHDDGHVYHRHGDGAVPSAVDDHDRVGCSVATPCDHGFCASLALPEPVSVRTPKAARHDGAVDALVDGLASRPMPPPPRPLS